MIRITIAAVGKRAPDWIQAGFAEYKKRLSHAVDFRLVEVRPAVRGKTATGKVLQEEAKAILHAIPGGDFAIALDEKGVRQTTARLSEHLGLWLENKQNICFVIGGADGLHSSVKESADELWSLSDYTLPHLLVRVILAEQLYRAWSLLNNHPYHRE